MVLQIVSIKIKVNSMMTTIKREEIILPSNFNLLILKQHFGK